jgi:hypothetical protein
VKTPLKILAVAVLTLALLFVGPIAYRMGQRVGLYLSCPGDSNYCWGASGMAVLHGGRLPRR